MLGEESSSDMGRGEWSEMSLQISEHRLDGVTERGGKKCRRQAAGPGNSEGLKHEVAYCCCTAV